MLTFFLVAVFRSSNDKHNGLDNEAEDHHTSLNEWTQDEHEEQNAVPYKY